MGTDEPTSVPFTLGTLPGTHAFALAGAGSTTFTTNPDGTISDPRREDNEPSGEGDDDIDHQLAVVRQSRHVDPAADLSYTRGKSRSGARRSRCSVEGAWP
jgi:hypothetical protein